MSVCLVECCISLSKNVKALCKWWWCNMPQDTHSQVIKASVILQVKFLPGWKTFGFKTNQFSISFLELGTYVDGHQKIVLSTRSQSILFMRSLFQAYMCDFHCPACNLEISEAIRRCLAARHCLGIFTSMHIDVNVTWSNPLAQL